MKLIVKHHPHLAGVQPPDFEKLKKMAKQFRSPHKWFEENSLKEVAYEESTWALDTNGQPQNWEYTYDVVYKLTSHEVHVTSVALELRIAECLENTNYPSPFRFAERTAEKEGDHALLNVCLHSQAATEHVFHAFNISVNSVSGAFTEWARVAGVSNPE